VPAHHSRLQGEQAIHRRFFARFILVGAAGGGEEKPDLAVRTAGVRYLPEQGARLGRAALLKRFHTRPDQLFRFLVAELLHRARHIEADRQGQLRRSGETGKRKGPGTWSPALIPL
jgi:hypothetical protein